MTIQDHEVRRVPYALVYRLPEGGVQTVSTTNFAAAWRQQQQVKAHTDSQGPDVAGVSETAIQLYAAAATLRANAEELEPDYWYASMKDLRGVWGDGASREEALSEFRIAASVWVEAKLLDGDDDIPPIGGAPLNPRALA